MAEMLTASDGLGRLNILHPIRLKLPINKRTMTIFATFDLFFIDIHIPFVRENKNLSLIVILHESIILIFCEKFVIGMRGEAAQKSKNHNRDLFLVFIAFLLRVNMK
jgi:hypothetical protein